MSAFPVPHYSPGGLSSRGFAVPSEKAKAFALAKRLPWPVWCVCAYLALITIFGKGPTYLVLPPLYFGEVVLIVGFGWLVNRYGLYRACFADESLLAWLIAGFMALGAVLTSQCVGDYGINAVRDAALWYYGIFFFIGHAIASDEQLGNRVWRLFVLYWSLALLRGTMDQLMMMTLGWGATSFPPILPWRGESLFFNSMYEQVQHIGLAVC